MVNLPGVDENLRMLTPRRVEMNIVNTMFLEDRGFCPVVFETPEIFKSFEIFADPEQAAEQQEL